jgi:EAL domain-containing protein (putative c-di-GMP-specific phosphodiesterase class I)
LLEDLNNLSSKPEAELRPEPKDIDQKADFLLVKVLVTNLPVIEDEFGVELALAAVEELRSGLSSLNAVAEVKAISNSLLSIRAKDISNLVGFIKRVQGQIHAVNSSNRYRFVLETSIGAVLTDHTSSLNSKDWGARLNLALLKSTRTGRPELAKDKVAISEQVRHELAKIGPGAPPPEGMYWVFQPINYVSTGEIFGYEILCRWDHPSMGPISPEMFIQIAEDLNLVQMIDFWTLASVKRSFKELLSQGGEAISINISAQTLGNDHEFFSAVDELLPIAKEQHFSLIFELTETSVIENQIDLSLGLTGLRKRGGKIAIDDFGTGKTSLSIISSLPTDFVKLDGSLLEVERPDLSRGLLELGVKFADLVGADVIVEKVETQSDLELARQVGAKFAQGWLFGQPIDLRKEKPSSKKSSSPA